MNVTPKDLLDAGVHFGHQTKRWNPRFKEFLFDHRQGISIIDLTKTHAALEAACQFLEDTVANGGDALLIGTKRQAQEIVREAAAATSMPFCANRWMGGTLTNFETIKRSIAKFKRFQEMESSGELAKMHKKEASAIKREMERMQRNFEGLSGLSQLPAVLVIIDTNYEDIAVAEGRRMSLPVVALVDTNSDPGLVTHPVPGNDDAVKSIRIIVDSLVEAIQSGLSQRDSRRISRGQQQLAETARPAVATATPVQPIIPAAVVAAIEPDVLEEVGVVVPDEAIAPVKAPPAKRPHRAGTPKPETAEDETAEA